MRVCWWPLAVALLTLLVPVVAAEATNTLTSAVSVSKQFVAHAPEPLLASALCYYAERVRREWSRALETGPTWRDPIIIVFDPAGSPLPPGTPPVEVGVSRTELGLKYRIAYRSAPLDQTVLTAAIVEALCAELSNRSQPLGRAAPFTVAPSPPWLVHGLTQNILGRDEALLQLARQSLAGGRPQTAGAVIGAPQLPADPAERRLFRANAWLLTEALLRLPRGAPLLQRYLSELAAKQSCTKAFWTTFVEVFHDDGALERWWVMELSDRLATAAAQNFTVPESSRRLDEILITRLAISGVATGGTSAVAFRELWRHREAGWLPDVLRAKQSMLADLRGRSVPPYRPVVEEYLVAAGLLAQNRPGPFRRAVARAEQTRARVEEQSRQIRDYLDQAERLHAPGEFSSISSNFFRVFEEHDALEQQRRNPISDYLDQFGK